MREKQLATRKSSAEIDFFAPPGRRQFIKVFTFANTYLMNYSTLGGIQMGCCRTSLGGS
jgi:hypothetical protein